MQIRGRRTSARDDGATLLFVLIFVMVVGLALGALLPYTQAGITEASTAREVRSTQNAVDGAVQGAIAQVRDDLEQGNERSGRCDDYISAPYLDPVSKKSVDVVVTCADALSAVGATAPNVPPFAIVTTVSGITVSGGHALAVDGGVYSAGNIDTTGSVNSSVVVVGDAYSATMTCGKVTATGKTCPNPAPAKPSVDFPSALGETDVAVTSTITALAKDPQGTCTSKQSIVTFMPGYYSEPPTVGATCTALGNTSKTWWFSPCTPYPSCTSVATRPGIYYFNFPDAAYAPNYTDAPSTTTGPGSLLDLQKDQISLVGGTLRKAWNASTKETALTAEDPGKRCDPTSTGVQIVLGGPSRIQTGNNSDIEICASATSSTSPQRIAIYGLAASADFGHPAATGPRTKVSTGPDGLPAGVASTPALVTSFRNLLNTAPNPGGARVAKDSLNVGVAQFTGAPATFGVDVTDFPTVAPGSLVSRAYLDVTHVETDSRLKASIEVTYSSGATDICDVPTTSTSLGTGLTQASLLVSRIDLMKNCQGNYLAKSPLRWRELNPLATDATKKLTVRYKVVGTNAITAGHAVIDGLHLETEVIQPAAEAERCMTGAAAGCVVEAYANSTSTSTDNSFFIGTIYVPTGDLRVVVHNSPNTIFQRGVVASGLTIVANSSSTQTDPPFQLPHSPVRNRSVLFTATHDGRVRLRALVKFIDCKPAPQCEADPEAEGNLIWPGQRVLVERWTTLS